MKHRKLFPTSTTTNQSMGCPDACDPSCPDGCYSFSDYFFPPPLPPPPPPPLSVRHGVSISPYVVVIATLLGLTLLILTYYLVVVKKCGGRGCFRPRRRQREGTEEGFLDENHGVGIDHPIWYIRTIGLQPSVIDSIMVFKYKKSDSLIEGRDCSVCLNEFQDDEILRLLPKCNHAFHIPCIDTWLRSHTNCPVCRAGIVSSAVATTPVAQDEDSQVEITEIRVDQGVQNNQETSSGGEVEDGAEFPENAENVASWIIDDLAVNNKMKRSISADSLVIAKIRPAMESLSMAELEASELKGPDKTGMHQSSIDQESVTVKRSVSYGGRSFFWRNSRNPNSILPP